MASRKVFLCQSCGGESPKWVGRCPHCGEWNTYQEKVVGRAAASSRRDGAGARPKELSQLSAQALPRLTLPLEEFNRVLGGGIVPGSIILVGGDPGIGKSTLLLAVAGLQAKQGKVLYISGEESEHQIKLRAERLGLPGQGLYLLSETVLESILEGLQETAPTLAIIDSIQTVYGEGMSSGAGSVTQVRECTRRLAGWAKSSQVPLFLVGHVTKDGTIAGPNTLEHMVDVVLYLEGEAYSAYRLLRSVKNRYGSTNEVGVFEMGDGGLSEVENPSQVFLAERPEMAVGSAIVPTLEGTRPLLVEVQALTNPSAMAVPRRTANGIDYNRLLLVAAVLTKRAGLSLSQQDIIANVVGGLKVNEPAAD
ncbi:MAG: DNA repair protein RadA, partial [Chloroflexota bacterium]|nr:DNA repair protein RadA [Chloroflexota bacterium]